MAEMKVFHETIEVVVPAYNQQEANEKFAEIRRMIKAYYYIAPKAGNCGFMEDEDIAKAEQNRRRQQEDGIKYPKYLPETDASKEARKAARLATISASNGKQVVASEFDPATGKMKFYY